MEKTKGRVLDSNPDSATFELWGWKTYALNQFPYQRGGARGYLVNLVGMKYTRG